MEPENDYCCGEENKQYGVAVLVGFTWGEPPYVDACLDITETIGDKFRLYETMRALDPDGDETKALGRVFNSVSAALHHMQLRRRFSQNLRGPYVFKADIPLTAEMVEAVIEHYTATDIKKLQEI